MNPEITSKTETMTESEKKKIDVNVADSGSLAPMSSKDGSGEQWQQIKDQVIDILSDLPDYLGSFFNQYQKPIVTIGLLVAVIVTMRVTLAVVDSINDIPLLAPTFELIGMGYSAWFIYRYLLQASSRQELWQEINSIKESLLGRKSS
ncbi:MAG TPA: CAAD domain-containing protein [Oscillatoriaceae cyanobacterium M33_DOE_052]|uniref:Cyanobacterial aminoacyl-tRNA synthetase CAAD domain-containing protein n=1 Tax=Planktothricoides sp. SpSt-374 TaxID=2282167 RepID=A0A7C3VQG1_9CYAN|nr:CAAD domain-containing protein [Oscillatoriaceae cyanobacterium M33_DOE_052]